jgi:hypothetical protein
VPGNRGGGQRSGAECDHRERDDRLDRHRVGQPVWIREDCRAHHVFERLAEDARATERGRIVGVADQARDRDRSPARRGRRLLDVADREPEVIREHAVDPLAG